MKNGLSYIGGGSASEALNTAHRALSRSVQLGLGPQVGLEVYVQLARTTTVKVFGGKVESLVTAEPRGLGVRVIDNGRVGYSYTADLSSYGMDAALGEAVDYARIGEGDEFQTLPLPSTEGYPVLTELWRPGVSAIGIDKKISLALQAEKTALAMPYIETVEISEYTDSDESVALVSNQGIEAESRRSFCFSYVYALAANEADRQSGLGFTMGREPADLDVVAAGSEAAKKACALLGAAPCPTGTYTLVFDRDVAAALLSAIISALSADAVQKGRSVFRDKLGELVASDLVTLWDDGLATGGLATSPFDGEGVPQKSTLLIKKGKLRNFLHSNYTARKESTKTASTGNAGRTSYRSLPVVRATNLVLQPGQGDLFNLISRTKNGLYVESVAGLHSGINSMTGEISVGITGRLIRGGDLGRPVREVTIAGDFISLLQSVCDIADDIRWIPLYGSIKTPSLAVTNMMVSGK